MARTAKEARTTNETNITVEIDLDGSGSSDIKTGIPFFEHMLDQLSRHSLIDMNINAKGDTQIDGHHTVEDVGIVLGTAFAKALGDKSGIRRYANVAVPMNETLVETAIDISGRPYCVFTSTELGGKVGEFDVELAEEFLRAFCNGAGITAHITVVRGGNMHHVVEAIFKSLARALGDAVCIDKRREGIIPSTKGAL